jgi:DNA-binding transcriptional LysR family regulator
VPTGRCRHRFASGSGRLIAEVFHAAGLNVPSATVIASSLQMNDALLANGQYLAFYPGSVLRLAGKQPMIKILPVNPPALRTPAGIATLKNRLISPLAQLFIDCAREMTRSLDLGSPAR